MKTPRTRPPYQITKEESTPPNSLSLSSMAQLDQNLCGRKTKKKERKNGKEKKEKIDRSFQMSSNQTNFVKTCSQEYPSATPQKIPIFITVVQKSIIFHRAMWAFLGFLSRSEFHRGNRESKNLLTSSLSLSYFSFLLLYLHPLSSLFLSSLFLTRLSFFLLSISLYLSFSLSIIARSWLLGSVFLCSDEENESDCCYGVFSICCV